MLDWGSLADWFSFGSTGLLALFAYNFSKRQYHQQRDPELQVVLRSVAAADNENNAPETQEESKHFAGYELVAINNSESNCVILQNTTPKTVTDERSDVFHVYKDKDNKEEFKEDKDADKFVMDKEVLNQSAKPLWHFSSLLRGRIPYHKNYHGSADKMDWYFYDVVNDTHYQVIITQSANNVHRLVTELHSQPEPFPKEEWNQELDIHLYRKTDSSAKDTPDHLRNTVGYELSARNSSDGDCVLRNTTPKDGPLESCFDKTSNGEFSEEATVKSLEKRTLFRFTPDFENHFIKANPSSYPSESLHLYFYDSKHRRHYQVIVLEQSKLSDYPKIEVSAQQDKFTQEDFG